jgi:hypothetical protein
MLRLALMALTLGSAIAAAETPPPTPEAYIAHVGGEAQLLAPGELVIDGSKPLCGQRPTVLDPALDDFSAAYAGFIIINPKRIAKLPTPVKQWIYAQACGYQFRGPESKLADCFAVQRGRTQGWLTADGMDAICRFMAPAKGSSQHATGTERCEAMRACFADPTVR